MKLIILRHGQSIWNLENRFTGWTDVGLSEKGIEEAKEAGIILKKLGYKFDIAYVSVLKRAKLTLDIVLDELKDKDIKIVESWKLNERHYGALQGINKDEAIKEFGSDQVQKWRRSANVRPPELKLDDPRYPGNDPLYKDLSKDELPLTENLYDTIDRVINFWNIDIKYALLENKSVIIVAHGNSLRALMMYLDNLTEEEVLKLEIETGNPICYELDNNLKPIKHYYLKDN